MARYTRTGAIAGITLCRQCDDRYRKKQLGWWK